MTRNGTPEIGVTPANLRIYLLDQAGNVTALLMFRRPADGSGR